MKRFIEVVPRTQVSLLPECLDGSLGRHSGQLDAAIDPHQRCPRRLRRGQAQEGLENSSGRRYAGQSACQPLSTASPLEVVKLPEAKRGFVLLPRRWMVERSFDWAARFRRLARDYERLPETLAGLHYLAFACLMLPPDRGHEHRSEHALDSRSFGSSGGRACRTAWVPCNRLRRWSACVALVLIPSCLRLIAWIVKCWDVCCRT